MTDNAAPRWRALLEQIAHHFDLPNPCEKLDDIVGMSFPDLATEMVIRLADKLKGVRGYEGHTQKERLTIAEAPYRLMGSF